MKWMLWMVVVVLGGAGSLARGAWLAGAAAVDITPEKPVRLSGYGSRTTVNEGVAQRLFAKALVLKWDAEAPLVMLTVDNCGVPGFLRSEVIGRLQKAGVPVVDERFALHSSHTHCAPMLRGVLPFLFGKDLTAEEQAGVGEYTDFLGAALVKVVTEAHGKLAAASLDWEVGQVGFAKNRRKPTPSGIANDIHPAGPVDHDLPVLRVTDAAGKVRAIYTSYACHCTTLAINQVHGDWAGCAQADLERAYPGVVALTAIGCGADQNPQPRRELVMAEQHGAALAAEAGRVLGGTLRAVRGPVTVGTGMVRLPFEGGLTREDWVKRTQDKKGAIAYHAAHFLREVDAGRPVPESIDYGVQVWTFGEDVCLVNLPGEVVVDYGLRLKGMMDRGRVWVNSYTNDVPCYIPSQRVWEEGGYEADTSMTYYGRPTRFASGVETLIFGVLEPLLPKGFGGR
jgi:neutral ceramidase